MALLNYGIAELWDESSMERYISQFQIIDQ